MLDPDYVKIDRSLVSDMSASDVLRDAIQSAHDVGATVVGEGVETDEHLARLIDLGCDMAQGFLFARPLPWPEFTQRTSLPPTT